eukprot:TRINITY_DN14242_c0_g1_i4.p1 TRINITY_DN14242_c0_g1~~TRINITY_DN14242_c0_g1_i4.p1  ORF type:complete len:253 (-),score=69.66 TRINITY_DN14242_c0_g1_i4:111-869(-)
MGVSNFRKDIVKAIETNDFDTLKRLSKADIYSDGRILNMAITLNSILSFVYLLDKCSTLPLPVELNINSADQYGATPVEHCLEKENYDALQLLFERGAVLTTEEHGKYLIKAATLGKAHIVQLLLDQGIDVNFKDKHKETAIFKSVRNKYWRTSEVLVKNGADVRTKNFEGTTPLDLAKQERLFLIAKLLESGSALSNKSLDGSCRLTRTASSKSSLVVTDTALKVPNKKVLSRVNIEKEGVSSCCYHIINK